jgi:hypothetical protein
VRGLLSIKVNRTIVQHRYRHPLATSSLGESRGSAMGAPSGHGQRNKKHNTGRHASKNTRAKHKTGVEDGGHRRTVKVRALAAAAAAHDFRPFASVPAPRPSCGRIALVSRFLPDDATLPALPSILTLRRRASASGTRLSVRCARSRFATHVARRSSRSGALRAARPRWWPSSP